MSKTITVIPATYNMHTRQPTATTNKRKVAAYARVSTDSDEQFTSYEAQIDYYTNFIKSHSEWEFVKVYTDEGISGTNTKKRKGFNEMIEDALAGKIDLIVTKSVSRFARNTVDSLSTIRQLKDKGIEVYFEKESIWTFDSKGELLITIMSSLAQEESRSISENVTWGRRKQFADGKVSLPYKQFLGYRKGKDGLPEIVPEEAETVGMIYKMFVDGKAPSFIARHLTESGIPTPSGKKVWQVSVVESILTNEKYKGDARLQKSFTTDFLNKKMKTNEGEVPQYYVENSHPAIIDPTEWQKVQAEIARRKNSSKRNNCSSPFAGKVFCGDCGEIYGRKVWHSTDKYRREIWQCNSKFSGKKCTTPHFTEKQLIEYYTSALSKLLANREQILDDGRLVQAVLSNTKEIDKQLEEIDMELQVVAELVKKAIDNNATHVLNQEEYNQNYARLTERYENLANKRNDLLKEKTERKNKLITLGGFLFEIHELEELDMEFREERLNATVERVTAYAEGYLIFTFRNGSEIKVEM